MPVNHAMSLPLLLMLFQHSKIWSVPCLRLIVLLQVLYLGFLSLSLYLSNFGLLEMQPSSPKEAGANSFRPEMGACPIEQDWTHTTFS